MYAQCPYGICIASAVFRIVVPYVSLRFAGVVSVKCSELNVQTNHRNLERPFLTMNGAHVSQ